jgi:acyl-[acyl-carrier-protein] desaturase
MGSAVPRGEFGTAEQRAVLISIEPFVAQRTDEHLIRRKLWFPNEHMPADEQMPPEADAELARLRDAARSLPDAVRVSIALNLLTEEGLPHFHRLIALHLGYESQWQRWNNLWTAEEDRHGCALRDYVRDTRLFNMGALEKLQYAYIESSFNPDWEHDPYRLLAYTSLQERATQVAHANTGRTCAAYEPKIQSILAHIAADESRHYDFYRRTFGEILRCDPNRALESLLHVMPALAMPGHSMPGYEQMAEVVRRSDIYGPRHYAKIVSDLLEFWKIGALTALNLVGRVAQEKLMKIPTRLEKLAGYVESKTSPREFRFDILYGRTVTL